MNGDLHQLTIQELGRLYRDGSLSPVEVTQALLDRIEHLNPELNCFITVTRESAIAEAQLAEQDFRNKIDRGPLQGVPVSLKDIFWTAGVRTTAASRILKDFIPSEDAEVVQRLRRAGAVILGKNNMKEFSYGQVHPDYGPAVNPWNPAHTSGGSSSGSAVSVATGLAFAAMGSDTGGSLRNPASFCGVVALKPTFGLVSSHGVIPLSRSLDHVGPITRTVGDNALVLGVVAGYDAKNPTSAKPFPNVSLGAHESGVKGVRIGSLLSYSESLAAPAVQSAVRHALDCLQDAGAIIHELSWPQIADIHETFTVIVQAEAAAFHLEQNYGPAYAYHPIINKQLESGRMVLAVDYLNAQRKREQLHHAVESAMRDIDVLILPTTITTAPPETGVTDLAVTTKLTALFNLTGQPAISLPCGLDPEGLPIGLQIVGRRFQESLVYRVAAAAELAIGFRGWTDSVDM